MSRQGYSVVRPWQRSSLWKSSQVLLGLRLLIAQVSNIVTDSIHLVGYSSSIVRTKQIVRGSIVLHSFVIAFGFWGRFFALLECLEETRIHS